MKRRALLKWVTASGATVWFTAAVQGCISGNEQSEQEYLHGAHTQEALHNLALLILPGIAPQTIDEIFAYQHHCFAPDQQALYVQGLKACMKKFPALFSKGQHDVTTFLKQAETYPEDASGIRNFFHAFKNLCIRFYTGSAAYQTRVLKYVLVPGKYEGCKIVSVKTLP